MGTVSGTIAFNANVKDERESFGLATSKDVGLDGLRWAMAISNGPSASQANKVYQKKRTLGGASEDLDLAGGLTDVEGTTLTFSRIISIGVRNVSTTNNVVLGAASSNQWATLLNATGTITLRPGEWIVFCSPDATAAAVTAGTGDILKVAGTSGQAYEIFVIGS